MTLHVEISLKPVINTFSEKEQVLSITSYTSHDYYNRYTQCVAMYSRKENIYIEIYIFVRLLSRVYHTIAEVDTV